MMACIYRYDWVPLLYSRNWHNIVNQLYFNTKKKDNIKKEKVSMILTFEEMIKERFVTGQMSPLNITEYYHLSKAVEVSRQQRAICYCLGVDISRYRQGLCLLGTEVSTEVRKRTPCQQEEPSYFLFRTKQKMTPVKAIILSDVV